MRQETFGQTIKRLRKARGLTQVELAVELGLSRSHLANMEVGNDAPGREILVKLADFFRVSLDDLTNRSGGTSLGPKSGVDIDADIIRDLLKSPENKAALGLWVAFDHETKLLVLDILDSITKSKIKKIS